MYRHASLCGCVRILYPIDWLPLDLAQEMRAVTRLHYQEIPECWVKAGMDPAWLDRRPLPGHQPLNAGVVG